MEGNKQKNILTIGAVVIFLAALFLLPHGLAERCASIGRFFTSPGMELTSIGLRVSREALGGLPENMSVKERDKLIAEYTRAANEARKGVVAHAVLNQRIAELQQMLRLVRLHKEDYSSVVCETIKLSPFGASAEQLLINRGAVDGIRSGQAVMTSDGVIGVVSECMARQSFVTLISSPFFSIPVNLPRLAVTGVLERHENGLWITDVMGSDYPSVRPGENVVSSSLGGAEMTDNLTIGQVSEIGQGMEGGPQFKVTPAVKFNTVPRFVVVCVPYNK